MVSHRSIIPKRHLNRSRLHLNRAGASLFVSNFRVFLNSFDKIFLETQQQRVDKSKSIIVRHLNINLIRNKFILAESIVKTFDLFLYSESKLESTFPFLVSKFLGETVTDLELA